MLLSPLYVVWSTIDLVYEQFLEEFDSFADFFDLLEVALPRPLRFRLVKRSRTSLLSVMRPGNYSRFFFGRVNLNAYSEILQRGSFFFATGKCENFPPHAWPPGRKLTCTP